MITVQAPHCPSPQPNLGPQIEVIPQDVKQRSGSLDIRRVPIAVDV
jgi:hypothetical protein